MTEDRRLRPKYVLARLPEIENMGDYTHIEIILQGRKCADMMLNQMCATDPEDVNSPFVLMPCKDPAAFAAMITYMSMCEPKLAEEIRVWLRKIAEAPPAFGTQGARNFSAYRVEGVSRAD